jgi:D-lactate dehydrogenase
MESTMGTFNIKYDAIHFEALGPEAQHLDNEIKSAVQQGLLPESHKYLITPENIQNFLSRNTEIILPDLISTKTHSVVPAEYLDGPTKSIITRSAGYDHFEHLTDKANIASLREYCVKAVSQTAIKFVYATAGMLNHYEGNCATFERKNSSAFIELGKHLTLTVFGVGKIGKCIYDLAEANGLTVQGVDIRQDELDRIYDGKVNFVSKEEAIASSDIIVNVMNLTRNRESRYYNVGYFSNEYLSKAPNKLIFINVTRGEIAPEDVLLNLYLSGKIVGIGLDVFSSESEFANKLVANACQGTEFEAAHTLLLRSLDRSANIYVQPHQGFNSDIAALDKAVEAVKHVVSWYKNGGRCFDEQLPYY